MTCAWLIVVQAIIQIAGSFMIVDSKRELFHKVLPITIVIFSVGVTLCVITCQSYIIDQLIADINYYSVQDDYHSFP